MPDLGFTLSGDNLTLTTVGGARLDQTGPFQWALVDGVTETFNFLPALPGGTSYHAVCANKLLIPGYEGPAFDAIRNSDSAVVPVYFTGDTVAPADIAALRGSGSVLRLSKRYDQTGNGRHETQTDPTRRVGVHEDAYVNGAPLLLHDGGVHFIGGPQGRGFDFTWALSGGNCTVFAVTDFKASTQLQFLFAIAGSSGVGRAAFHNYNINGSIVEQAHAISTSTWVDKQFRAGLAVYGFREKAAPLDLIIDGTPYSAKTTADNVSPGPAPTVETLTAGKLGYTASVGFENYQPNMRSSAFLAVNGPVSDDLAAAISNALRMAFGVPTRFDSRAIIIGDSIAEGGANTNTLELMWYLRQQAIKGTPEFYNEGISGKTLTACYDDRLLFDNKLYRADVPLAPVLQGGTNDLHNSVAGATLYTTQTTYTDWWRGRGANVAPIGCTIPKRTDFTGAMETQRVDYNTRLRANTGGTFGATGKWAALWDVDAVLTALDPNYMTNAAILGDGVHPTSYGYSQLAPSLAAAINSVLP